MSKKVISYCIYGNNIKYLNGLLKNITIINNKLPDFFIYIYCGCDINQEIIDKCRSFNNINLIQTDIQDSELMSYRMLPITYNDISICFSRDVDSPITDRDIWTMNDFINSNKLFHIVRDHYWHKNKIMGGIYGIKKELKINIYDEFNKWKKDNNITKFYYGTDERFLQEYLYPLIIPYALIHSNIVGYLGENITLISNQMENEYDFIGNVIEYDNNFNEYYKFKYYDFSFEEHFYFLYKQEQWKLLIVLFEKTELYNTYKSNIWYIMFMSYYYINNIDKCIEILNRYKYSNVDEHLIINSNYLFYKLNKDIIATTDLLREPKENEIVIYYGNFYHSIDCLPVTNRVYRHPKYFNSLKHTFIEYDECWEKIDIIYILNLEERGDRYLEILIEICKMNAPLNRIYHYKAKRELITGNKNIDVYYGACDNHIKVIQHFIENKYNYCLILEDDFTFSSHIDKHKKDLNTFLNKNYDFDVCLISSSKYGSIKPFDELLSLSFQECTTSSGYILSAKTIQTVLETLKEGNKLLLETGDSNKYANDRYWSKLQYNNKFFIFNLKFGYQRPSYSSITQKFDSHFD
jgi:GR25 family glycosyltransferase involved in LPS biosynthesis